MALVINAHVFKVLGREDIHLCSMGDRVALLLYLLHKDTGKHVLVANTHLSFPHHALDRLNQMQQMKKLISSVDAFAERHNIKTATRIGTDSYIHTCAVIHTQYRRAVCFYSYIIPNQNDYIFLCFYTVIL